LLIKNDNEKEDLFIEPGDWNYPFEYQLPKNIPSTYHHSIGKIEYFVKAHLDIPWFV
jgi:sporulation-control protein spo0M